MKVESRNDVQTVQRPDQPVIHTTSVPVPAKGVDELAHLFNQEVELNKLPLAHRQMGVRVPAAEKLVELYDQLGHPAQASMAAVSRRIRMQLLQSASVEKLLDIAGGDPARAFVVLKHLANEADTEIRKSEAALARSAIAKLEARFKGQIQAGLNIAVALQAACADPEERQALRSLYYASVVTRQSLATMMQALLGVYGGDGFQEGLNVMRKALADDIAALVSSMPTPLLRSLLVGLRSCGQLSAVLASCVTCKQRLEMEDEAVTLLQRLLGYASSGIGADEILRLGNEMGSGSPTRQLTALNALYPLIRQLPLALWPDTRVREESLFKFVAVMDELNRIDGGAQRSPALAGAMT
ncbi:TyeA family type III secretion system gatekeeper subunit [Pseudomonas salmasensis]|uniref:TyeA family type III secretion system gatekeeper subunit n=1 Tax=Pseudomonas salmasensis TaxID=2745514 RepID=A0ABU5FDZ0_9PSED|nr:TyeA family type III secretion system gatekeeper subunit [Pseudomonas salmasensis]MDY4298542.1 TyeA family type III secretion system gatekeeper subunit [Pseudomonas salmasensis]